MNLIKFYGQLSSHDWTHQMSDSFRVVQAGDREQKRLKAIANRSVEHTLLYDAWWEHIWRNGPKPEKPTVKRCWGDNGMCHWCDQVPGGCEC